MYKRLEAVVLQNSCPEKFRMTQRKTSAAENPFKVTSYRAIISLE